MQLLENKVTQVKYLLMSEDILNSIKDEYAKNFYENKYHQEDDVEYLVPNESRVAIKNNNFNEIFKNINFIIVPNGTKYNELHTLLRRKKNGKQKDLKI